MVKFWHTIILKFYKKDFWYTSGTLYLNERNLRKICGVFLAHMYLRSFDVPLEIHNVPLEAHNEPQVAYCVLLAAFTAHFWFTVLVHVYNFVCSNLAANMRQTCSKHFILVRGVVYSSWIKEYIISPYGATIWC